MRLAGLLLALAAASGFGSGCGYSLQGSSSAALEKIGIRRIYVSPLDNNTYKPGVENLVYNSLIRTIAASRRVALVPNADGADAVLSGSVNTAVYSVSATTRADNLFPSTQIPALKGSSEIYVATVYVAALECSFSLKHRYRHPPDGQVVWSSSFQRSKPFPANNQLDVFGSTAALINESEFDRALRDLAESMSGDLHESLLAMF